MENKRQRVNGAFLSRFHGRQVCLLGTIVKGEAGSAIQVRAADGAQITVRMKTPVNESLSGLIEVFGIGQGKSLIMADSYSIFPEEVEKTFDMASYNEYLKLINTLEAQENPWRVD